MDRVYNFSAGPSCLPEEVLKECAAEMLNYNGTGQQWKIREGSNWDNNRGGAFATAGTPFEAVAGGGDNINLGDMTNYSVVYDPAAETITIQ